MIGVPSQVPNEPKLVRVNVPPLSCSTDAFRDFANAAKVSVSCASSFTERLCALSITGTISPSSVAVAKPKLTFSNCAISAAWASKRALNVLCFASASTQARIKKGVTESFCPWASKSFDKSLRKASNAVASISLNSKMCGIVNACDMLAAIWRRSPRSGITVTPGSETVGVTFGVEVGDAVALAACTSSAVIWPFGPEPETFSSATPRLAASRLVLGLASGRTFVARAPNVEGKSALSFVITALGSVVAGEACALMSLEISPLASIFIRLAPTARTSPAATHNSITFPATGAGISI